MIGRQVSFWFLVGFAVGLLAQIASAAVVGEGVISSDEKVSFRSQMAAPVQKIPVKEGQLVRRGDLLVELDNDLQRAQVAQIELQLQIAKREYERNLTVPDLITEKELDLSRDAVSQVEAQLAVAKANLENTLIKAPFDGIISRIYVRVGDTPRVSDTVLLDLLSLDKLYVEVALPLSGLPLIRTGMAVQLDVESQIASIKTSLKGTVLYVYPEIDSITRMFRAKVEVPRKGLLVLPGMFVKVVIEPRRELPSLSR